MHIGHNVDGVAAQPSGEGRDERRDGLWIREHRIQIQPEGAVMPGFQSEMATPPLGQAQKRRKRSFGPPCHRGREPSAGAMPPTSALTHASRILARSASAIRAVVGAPDLPATCGSLRAGRMPLP